MDRQAMLDSIRKNLGSDFAEWLEKTMAERDALRPTTQEAAVKLRTEIGNMVAERTHLRNAGRLYSREYRAIDRDIRLKVSLLRESGFRADAI